MSQQEGRDTQKPKARWKLEPVDVGGALNQPLGLNVFTETW